MKYALVLAVFTALAACAPLQTPSPQTAQRHHVVQTGENIHVIAFLYQTTPEQLQIANPYFDTARLQPGMRVKLPASVHDSVFDYARSNGSGNAAGSAADPAIRASGFIWPLQRFRVSSRFGQRKGRLHAGIDLRAPRGTPIYASASGKVVFAGYSGGYGRMIVIDHGRGIQTAYAHNSRNLVATGQRVRQGDVIGNVGRTGNATGSHVHFEFRRHGNPLNPAQHLQTRL